MGTALGRIASCYGEGPARAAEIQRSMQRPSEVLEPIRRRWAARPIPGLRRPRFLLSLNEEPDSQREARRRFGRPCSTLLQDTVLALPASRTSRRRCWSWCSRVERSRALVGRRQAERTKVDAAPIERNVHKGESPRAHAEAISTSDNRVVQVGGVGAAPCRFRAPGRSALRGRWRRSTRSEPVLPPLERRHRGGPPLTRAGSR
jgi:hypothetical protein